MHPMAKFKIIISDPETRKSQVVELEGSRAVPLIGRRLGETVDGSIVGQSGIKMKITGGCDKDGFPMRPDIHGGVRTNTILSSGVGFHPRREGERRRKTIRGNVITEEIVQINMKSVKESPQKAEKTEKVETVKAEEKTEAAAEEEAEETESESTS